MTRILKLASAVTLVISSYYLESCSAGKSAYEHGDYYNAVLTSTNRLRRSPDHKKSRETLRQSYPLAVKYYEDRANASLASNDRFKWSAVVQAYTYINSMYDEINRSPGALAVIPHPVNYYAKLEDAKRNAAQENYDAGMQAMALGTREDAKHAYEYFKTANDYVPGFKDVNDMMEAALWAATVKVVMQPIPVPSSNVAVSAEFFDNKMSEYLHASTISPYVRFFTAKEAETIQLDPDHIIQLQFDEFTVGQTHLEEKEIQLQKDSVVMAEYVTPTATSPNPTKVGGLQNQGAGTQSLEPAVTETSQPATTQPAGGGGTETRTTQQSQTTQQSTTQQSTTQPAQGGKNTNNNVATQATQESSSGTQSQQANTATKADPSGTQTQQPAGNSQVNQGQNTSQPGEATPANKNTQQNQGNAAGAEQVTICHRPPGNTTNTQTLVVPRSALQAHLNHGDVLGSCNDVKQKTDKNAGQGGAKGQGNEKTVNDKATGDKAVTHDEQVNEENVKEGNKEKEKNQQNDEKTDKANPSGGKDQVGSGKKEDTSIKKEGNKSSDNQEVKQDSEKAEKADKEQGKDQKETDSKGGQGQDQQDDTKTRGKDQARAGSPVYVASAGSGGEIWEKYFASLPPADTNKVYGTVKATFHQFRKTVVSRGVIDFRIIDTKTKALLSVEKIPGEFVWVSEWGYFNGDERALSAGQLEITKHREQMPPPAQDLFIGFTAPLFDQITQKIQAFYKGY